MLLFRVRSLASGYGWLAATSLVAFLLSPRPAVAQAFDFTTRSDSVVPLGRLADPDSVISIEAPEDWVEHDLGVPDASIQIGTTTQDAFFMVMVEDKVDLHGWNLDRYSYITLAQTLGTMDFPEILENGDLEVDGRPSRRFVIQGASGGMQLTFVKVTVDGPSAFIQLVGWSTRSSFDTHGPVISQIVESVQSLR